MRPLEGIFVLDFSGLLPGPMATLLLAAAGAEVVKVERPKVGDEMRTYVPRWGRDSVNFALLNRGKSSIAVDLKDPDARRALEPSIARADVLVEQFRPGVMDRLGLGYEAVRALNPRIVYCSITGYGQNGPKRDAAGHDLNYLAESGLLALSSGPSDRPVVPPALIADIAGGAYPAVMNILLALRERDRTGTGRHLDVAMSENLFPFMYWAIGNGSAADAWPGNGTDLVTGGTPRYRLYPTADGRLVAAAPIEPKFWETFCDILGLPADLRDDARDPAATIRAITATIAAHDAAHWAARFDGRDCCCSIVLDLREAMASPHFRARGIFDRRQTGPAGTLPALPLPLAAAYRGDDVAAAPELGADGARYLA